MGLLDFFRRKGGMRETSPAPGAPATEQGPADRTARPEDAPPGLTAEGPPVGTSDPGSLTGEDAAPGGAEDEPQR